MANTRAGGFNCAENDVGLIVLITPKRREEERIRK